MRSLLGSMGALAAAYSLNAVAGASAAEGLAQVMPLLKTGGRQPRMVPNYHKGETFVDSTHITAKTHRGIPCRATRTAAAALADHGKRLSMLKARKERRDARA